MRIGILFFATIFAMVAHRFAAYWSGDTTAQILRDDLFILAVGCFATGLFGSRRWLIASGVLLTGGFLAAALPQQIVYVFGGCTLGVMLMVGSEQLSRKNR